MHTLLLCLLDGPDIDDSQFIRSSEQEVIEGSDEEAVSEKIQERIEMSKLEEEETIEL